MIEERGGGFNKHGGNERETTTASFAGGTESEKGRKKKKKKKDDGLERDDDRSTAGIGYSDVLQCPTEAPIYASSVGARSRYGIRGGVCESAGEMGRSATGRP
ncbi:hypothetical protein LINGRAPRIM_LOCUS1014 [Linum grandiflorum]